MIRATRANDDMRMPARLLVIADHDTVDRISKVAPDEWWTIRSAELGTSLKTTLLLRPDAIILDAREPGQSFAEFCRTLRSIEDMAHLPLVALVGAARANDLELLEAGVDDCWAERIESRQFVIRLMGIHRRLDRSRPPRILRHGEVELDLDRYTVRSSGSPVQLTARQLIVLQYLMERAGVSVSYRDLLERAWCNTELGEGAVRTCIKRLRRALTATGAVNVIRNVSGGYLFDTGTQPLKLPWP